MPGFGVGPPDGVYIDPSDHRRAQDPVGGVSDDLHAIRVRHVPPRYLRRYPFSFSAANGTLYIETPTNAINAFTVTVVTGVVSVWLGNYSGQTGLSLPDYQFGAGATAQIFLPLGVQDFTVQSTGGAASGVLNVMAI